MYGRYLVAVPVQICNTLAPGTEGHFGFRRGRMVLPYQAHGQFAGSGSIGVSTLVKDLTQLAWADLTLWGDDSHDAA